MLWNDTKPRCATRFHKSINPFRCSVSRTDGDIAIEVGTRETIFLGRAVSEMRDSRRSDVAPPAVFQRHRDPHGNAKVADLFGFGQSPKFADLQIHHVHRQVRFGSQQHVEAVDVLIQHKWMVGVAPNGQAFFVG